MTAEVAVMNAQGVALAADSAVTFGREGTTKVFSTANKIFTLSKYHPVGVMIYGSANLIGTPWETLIKRYRTILRDTSYPALDDYAKAFIEFLKTDRFLFHPDLEEAAITAHLRSNLLGLLQDVLTDLDAAMKEQGQLTEDQIKATASESIAKVHRNLSANPDYQFPLIEPDAFLTRCRSITERVTIDVFKDLPFTDEARTYLIEIAEFLLRQFDPDEESGVVFAGFGADELFPVLSQYTVKGVSPETFKFEQRRLAVMEIGIYPFAQTDVVNLFMSGVASSYQAGLLTLMSAELPQEVERILDEVLTKEFKKAAKRAIADVPARVKAFAADKMKKLSDERRQLFGDQMVSIVRGLPKEELAVMAESLVSLTSLRRKVSFGQETVGGPIDVAVISRGDGFIWIKRKHYFDPALNRHYFENYFRTI